MISFFKRIYHLFRSAARPESPFHYEPFAQDFGQPERESDHAAMVPLPLDAQLAIANRQMSEEVIRQRIRENVQRFREAANNNPASAWALSFVDPYDWAMDTPDFYPGIGWGAGWGVPWLLNNQGRGDVMPVYINEMGLKIIRDWSRRTLAFNEFAINAVENRVSYIVGKGFQYTVVPKKKPSAPVQKDLDMVDSGPAEQLAAVAQKVLDEFISRERWNEREQECVRRCDRDGEAILRFFHVGNGRTAVRFVEPEFLTEGQEYQRGDKDTINSPIYRQYGVNTLPGDIEDAQSYSIVQSPITGAWLTEDVPAAQVLHIKLNVDFDCKRGLPTLFAVRKNLDRADKLLRNMSMLAQVQATFAVIRKHKQYAPSSVSAFQQNAADVNVTVPMSGRSLPIRQLSPGSIIDASDKTEYEFPSANVDASGLVAILQAELRATAARLCMPEFMLSVDASNANFASTMVAESPFVKKAEREQCFFGRHFGDGEYGERSGAMWRVLVIAVEGGLLPRAVLTELEIQAEGPTLVVRDKGNETKRAEMLSKAGILSDTTWAKWEGLDLEQEKKLGAAEKPEPSPFGLPGESDNSAERTTEPPAKGIAPAPPGSAEGMSENVKDASGHEHDEKGLFTGSRKARKASKAALDVSKNLGQWAKLSRAKGHESSEYEHPAGTAVKHSAAAVRAARTSNHSLAKEHHLSAAYEHDDAAEGHRGYSGTDVRHEEAAKLHVRAAKAHRKAAQGHHERMAKAESVSEEVKMIFGRWVDTDTHKIVSAPAGKDESGGKARIKAGDVQAATAEQYRHAIDLAKKKFEQVPQPSEQEIEAAKEGMARLGANKYRKNLVGNSKDRAKRRAALLSEFGDGEKCPCIYCGIMVREGTLEQDKILTTAQGGKYRLSNLVPACSGCNKNRSDMPFDEAMKKLESLTNG